MAAQVGAPQDRQVTVAYDDPLRVQRGVLAVPDVRGQPDLRTPAHLVGQ
jgi:hypothetical protein